MRGKQRVFVSYLRHATVTDMNKKINAWQAQASAFNCRWMGDELQCKDSGFATPAPTPFIEDESCRHYYASYDENHCGYYGDDCFWVESKHLCADVSLGTKKNKKKSQKLDLKNLERKNENTKQNSLGQSVRIEITPIGIAIIAYELRKNVSTKD